MKKLTLMIDSAHEIDFNAILAAVGPATVTIIVDGGAPPDTIDIGQPIEPAPVRKARKSRKSRLPPKGAALPPGAIVPKGESKGRRTRPKTDDPRIVTKTDPDSHRVMMDVEATAAAIGVSMDELMSKVWPVGSLEHRLRMSHTRQGQTKERIAEARRMIEGAIPPLG